MRRLRKLLPGASYHVTTRCNRKEKLLAPALAKELFLETIARAREKHRFILHSFVIMENHIHLLIEPTGECALPDIMKWVSCVFTMKYNRVFGKWGRVWGGRYFSRPVCGFADMVAAIEYIDRNPVKACLAAKAEEWPWSAISQHRSGCREFCPPPAPWMLLLFPGHSQLALGVCPRGTAEIPTHQASTTWAWTMERGVAAAGDRSPQGERRQLAWRVGKARSAGGRENLGAALS